MFNRKNLCLAVLLPTLLGSSAQKVFGAEGLSSTLTSTSAVNSTEAVSASENSSLNVADASEAKVSKGKRLIFSTGMKVPLYDRPVRPFSRFAVGFNTGTLGFGLQMTTNLAPALNLRVGASLLNFNYAAPVDGANFGANVALRSGEADIDWFPFRKRRFHISPGVIMLRNNLAASLDVAGGTSFTLGNGTYLSSATDPIHGAATLNLGRTFMPSVMVGFSNMLVKEGKHWSFPFEAGVAYTGLNWMNINLTGTACLATGCLSTSDPSIQSNLSDANQTVNQDLQLVKFYPIIRSGLAYRF